VFPILDRARGDADNGRNLRGRLARALSRRPETLADGHAEGASVFFFARQDENARESLCVSLSRTGSVNKRPVFGHPSPFS
jgi:hypothetical protein